MGILITDKPYIIRVLFLNQYSMESKGKAVFFWGRGSFKGEHDSFLSLKTLDFRLFTWSFCQGFIATKGV